MSLSRTDPRFKLLKAFFWLMILGIVVEGSLIAWELAMNVPEIAAAVGFTGHAMFHPTALTTGIFILTLVLYFAYNEYLTIQGTVISPMELITQKVEQDAK